MNTKQIRMVDYLRSVADDIESGCDVLFVGLAVERALSVERTHYATGQAPCADLIGAFARLQLLFLGMTEAETETEADEADAAPVVGDA